MSASISVPLIDARIIMGTVVFTDEHMGPHEYREIIVIRFFRAIYSNV